MSEWKEKIIREEPYGIGNELMHFHYTGEEIVRCRDCKHSDKTYWTCAHFRAYEGTCDECDLDIEPDGFCAWGERKDG